MKPIFNRRWVTWNIAMNKKYLLLPKNNVTLLVEKMF